MITTYIFDVLLRDDEFFQEFDFRDGKVVYVKKKNGQFTIGIIVSVMQDRVFVQTSDEVLNVPKSGVYSEVKVNTTADCLKLLDEMYPAGKADPRVPLEQSLQNILKPQLTRYPKLSNEKITYQSFRGYMLHGEPNSSLIFDIMTNQGQTAPAVVQTAQAQA